MAGALYTSTRAITAQAIRTVLFAIAIVVSGCDLFTSIDLVQAPVADALVTTLQITDAALVASNRLG